MKDKISIIFITFICASIGFGIYWNSHTIAVSYEEAISLTQEGNYDEAIIKLKNANSNKNFVSVYHCQKIFPRLF